MAELYNKLSKLCWSALLEKEVSSSSTEGRIVYLEILRVVASLGVVFMHASISGIFCEVMSSGWKLGVFNTTIVQWVVPVFFMISGGLFLMPSRSVTIKSVLSKRVPRILCAYLFWALVYGGLDGLLTYIGTGNWRFSTNAFFHFHLWFLPMLAAVYLLIPVLRKIAADEKVLLYAIALWFVCICLRFCSKWDIPQVSLLYKPSQMAFFAGYYLLGYCAMHFTLKKKVRLVIYAMGLLAIVFSLTGTFVWHRNRDYLDFKFLDTVTPHVVVMSYALFTLAKHAASRLKPWVMRLVEFVRKDLFGIYLTHAMWLLIFSKYGIFQGDNLWFYIPVETIVVFVLSLLTTKLLRSIPYLGRVVK